MARLRASIRHLAAAFAALVLVVPTASTAAPAHGTATWSAHAIRGGGSLSLPASWRDFTKKRGLDAAITRASLRTPLVRPLLFALTFPMGPLVKFVAADLARRSLAHGYATNVTLLVQPTPLSLQAWGERMVRALERSPIVVGGVRHGVVALPAGRALTFLSVQRVQAGNRQTPVSVTQYALARDGSVYLLTFTTTPRQRPAYAPVFARSAESFRIR